jgi:hypothetical protein
MSPLIIQAFIALSYDENNFKDELVNLLFCIPVEIRTQ